MLIIDEKHQSTPMNCHDYGSFGILRVNFLSIEIMIPAIDIDYFYS
jgi:hypothetical protein